MSKKGNASNVAVQSSAPQTEAVQPSAPQTEYKPFTPVLYAEGWDRNNLFFVTLTCKDMTKASENDLKTVNSHYQNMDSYKCWVKDTENARALLIQPSEAWVKYSDTPLGKVSYTPQAEGFSPEFKPPVWTGSDVHTGKAGTDKAKTRCKGTLIAGLLNKAYRVFVPVATGGNSQSKREAQKISSDWKNSVIAEFKTSDIQPPSGWESMEVTALQNALYDAKRGKVIALFSSAGLEVPADASSLSPDKLYSLFGLAMVAKLTQAG